MSIYLGYTTALWAQSRSQYRLQRAPAIDTWCTDFFESAADRGAVAMSAEKLRWLLRTQETHQLQLLAPSDAAKRVIKGTCGYVWKNMPERGAFIDLGEGVYLSSVEFCFLQMARVLPFIELVQLGYALCGRYFEANCEQGFVRSECLTSVTKLGKFLQGCHNIRGVQEARRAQKVLADLSLSPMESVTSMLFGMPRKQGGYGISGGRLNLKVDLSPTARGIVHARSCYLDLAWPQAKFALEYMGANYHTNQAKDEQRRLALSHDGWTIQFVYFRQLSDWSQREQIARRISSHLGKRFYPLTELSARRQRFLTKELLTRSETSGAFTRHSWALPEDLARLGQGPSAGLPTLRLEFPLGS